MPKLPFIKDPRKVTVYLPDDVVTQGREIAKQAGTSLSQLISELLRTQAKTVSKVRVHADFAADEYDTIRSYCEARGMSVEDLVRAATKQALNT